jgi:hypothetical protein
MNKADYCNFDPVKILKKGEKLESTERKKYYKEIITEAYIKYGARNIDAYRKGLTLKEILENEIMKIDDEQKNENAKTKTKLKKRNGNESLIWWKGTEPMIIYLFQLLYNANLIDDAQVQSQKHILISNHFKNRFGSQFDNVQLAKSFLRMVKKSEKVKPREVDADLIEDVLRDMRKYLREILEK